MQSTTTLRAKQKKAIPFKVLVVGRPFLGKSTFINSLLSQSIIPIDQQPRVTESNEELKFNEYAIEWQLETERLSLEIVDIENFMRASDVDKLVQYVEQQYEMTLEEENRIIRSKGKDFRVHLALYFISPNSIKTLDLQAMKRLSQITNVCPLLAKADSLTSGELVKYKEKVRKLLAENEINCFQTSDEEYNQELVTFRPNINERVFYV